MSVSSTTNRVSYSGNGVTTAFSFPHRALAAADFLVIEKDDTTGVETTKALTTHYTVSGEDAAWTITMLVAPATGTTLSIINDPEATQPVDLVENDSLPAETTEGALDRAMLVIQRVKDQGERSVRLSDGYSATFTPTLPSLLTANLLLGINAAGDGFELYSPVALGSVSLPASPGIAVYTGANTFIKRQIDAGYGISVSNGSGFAGNPTLSIPDNALQADATGRAKVADEFVNQAKLASEARQFPNWIANGNFDLWQRATSSAAVASATYTADRWRYYKATTAAVHTVARSTDVPTFAESGFPAVYSLHVDCTTADAVLSAGDVVAIQQRMEGFTWAQLHGKTVTISFWVKATKTGVSCVYIQTGNVDRSYVAEYTINAANTWERKTVTIALTPATGTFNYDHNHGFTLGFTLMAGSGTTTAANTWGTSLFYATANQVNHCDSTSNDFRLSMVKMNVGETAAPFSRFGWSYGAEVAQCERFYEKSYNIDVIPLSSTIVGIHTTTFINANQSTGLYELYSKFRTKKRAAPTMVYQDAVGNSGKCIYYEGSSLVNNRTVNSGATNESGFSIYSEAGAVTKGGIATHFTADAEL